MKWLRLVGWVLCLVGNDNCSWISTMKIYHENHKHLIKHPLKQNIISPPQPIQITRTRSQFLPLFHTFSLQSDSKTTCKTSYQIPSTRLTIYASRSHSKHAFHHSIPILPSNRATASLFAKKKSRPKKKGRWGSSTGAEHGIPTYSTYEKDMAFKS